MSKNCKFVLNRAGVRELMQSPEMIEVLKSYASQIANAAGEGYSEYIGETRANVSVRTETPEAVIDNLENNTLEKAVRS